MKIAIRDFGPIHSFDIDLDKELHIIYGENNIGKSYAIVLVYIIMKGLREAFGARMGSHFSIHDHLARTLKAGELEIPENGLDVTDLIWQVEKRANVKEFTNKLNESIVNSFGEFDLHANRRCKSKPKLHLQFESYELFLESDQSDGFSVVDEIQIDRVLIVEESQGKNFPKSHLLLSAEKMRSDIWFGFFEPELTSDPIVKEINKTCQEAFFLPASRSGLYAAMSIFGAVFAKLSQLRHAIKDKIEIPAISEPVSDYFLQLSTISRKANIDVFSRLGLKMESELIGATIDFNSDSKKLEYFSKELDLRLDLSDVSSMVAELAPIVAYLKYVISEGLKGKNGTNETGKVIFIEEPEAHMHPKVQLKLMEFFAELSNLGVNVIMTTHSNYIFNKASNLILEGKLSEEKVQNYHMIATEKGSIVNPHDTLSEMGFLDENFVDVAEQLLEERLIALESK